MECSKLSDQMQYIERNGVCLNIDEKMRLNLAINELKCDLGLKTVALIAKVTGKYNLDIFKIRRFNFFEYRYRKRLLCSYRIGNEILLVQFQHMGILRITKAFRELCRS